MNELEKQYAIRRDYLDKIIAIKSPISLVDNFAEIANLRTNDYEPIAEFLMIADKLDKLGFPSAQSRAKFIRMQCNQQIGEDFFEEHRESWGIPKFEEDLVTAYDFKNGFLWTAKIYTTSFSEDGSCKEWLFSTYEAIFIQNFEAWDSGDEMFHSEQGSCKEIFTRHITEYGIMDALASPIFSKQELNNFYEENKKYIEGYLLESLHSNPNW